ncbi:MAG: MvaI/BcnI family restriction endonuclease [Candidatus Paceibacterota bacterium]
METFTLEELVKKLKKIKSLGFVKTVYANDGGIGATLEKLLGIKENNLKLADWGEVEIKAKARNIHRPAERINKLLKITFPYKTIELRDAEDGVGYQLFRNDQECNFLTLSEGERNFLALAYFLLSLNTQDANSALSETGIVVIDDPVSSLDKNSIFNIFSVIIREVESKPNRQYIILTHSLDFFSHLHNQYSAELKKGDESKVGMYQVHIDSSGSRLGELNKMLKNYKSDYQYALKKLWDKRENCTLEDAYLLVNLLRRAWETFLSFKFNVSTTGGLKNLLDKAYSEALKVEIGSRTEVKDDLKEQLTDESRQQCLAMYRYLNYGSHEFQDTDAIDESVLLDTPQRIQSFFSVVKTLDPYHFKTISGFNE